MSAAKHTPVYTCSLYPSRRIERDGKPMVHLNGCAHVRTKDADSFALEIANSLNSHAALLEALKGLIDAEKRYCKDTGLKADDLITDAVFEAEKVLAKVTQAEKGAL